MTAKVKLILLGMVALLAVGALAATLASAEEEVEAPYWKVGKERLGLGHTEPVALKLKSGTKSVLRTKILGKNVEEVCSTVFSEEAAWMGSEPHTDGKVITAITFENCVLFVENSKKEFEEVPSCKDEPFTVSVGGKLWYEGSKEAHKETIVALLAATTGKILGSQRITSVEGKKCSFEGTYSVEGNVAALIKPENKSELRGEVIFPKSSITEVWQPQGGGVTEAVAMKFGEATATLEAEFTAELTSKAEFGVFSK